MFKNIISAIAGFSAGAVTYKLLSDADMDEKTIVIGTGAAAGLVTGGTGILIDKIEESIKSKTSTVSEIPEDEDDEIEEDDFAVPEGIPTVNPEETVDTLPDGYIPEGIPTEDTDPVEHTVEEPTAEVTTVEEPVQTFEDLSQDSPVVPAEDEEYQEVPEEVPTAEEPVEDTPSEEPVVEEPADFATQFIDAAESGDDGAVDALMESIEETPSEEQMTGSVMDYVSQTTKRSRKHPKDRGENLTRTERRLG